MSKQVIVIGLVALVVIGGGAFYGGMTYAQSKMPMRGQLGNGQFTTQFNGARGARTGGGLGEFTTGVIISKDASSITIKMQDGSTKIVLTSTSTQVMKTTSGTLNDLSDGTNVVVTGSANSDGSMTAQSVQIRPEGVQQFGEQQR